MKTKFELSVSISPEEHEILKKAESILQDICCAFDDRNQCDMCPMHTICYERLNEYNTPHTILYNIQNVLNIEREG